VTEDQARCCQEQLLPIWEKWTDGNPALRRFLACQSADPASHEERMHMLIRTTGDLRRLGKDSPGVQAAILAASASLKGYVGLPDGTWRAVITRAVAAARDALGPPAGDGAPK
jgi:hypothetical protein